MQILRYQVKRLAVSAESRTARFVLSTASEDRAGDTIDQSGWLLDNYMRNPVVLWGHESRDPPIGTMASIGLDGGNLVGTVKFAPEGIYPLADIVAGLSAAGVIAAGSVGFKPIEWVWNDKTGGIDFKKQELMEFSIVSIPANPEALIRNHFGDDATRKALREAARTPVISGVSELAKRRVALNSNALKCV